ncbi:MAG TPA: hypothetical protein VMW09_00175 [Desulfatiglandales bacterium]|nr:hypothetical protein [Desulfatiglandales bacterium]
MLIILIVIAYALEIVIYTLYTLYSGLSIYFFIDYHFLFDYVYFMPTEKPKILMVLDNDLLEKIEDFRYSNRIPTRSEAIRRLLEEALKKYEKKSKK